MPDIDPVTGLPMELGAWDTITKESQEIHVTMEKKKFGKKYTVITGITKDIDGDALLRKLKAKFACGGTIKEGRIELQGDHKNKVRAVLVDAGFPAESIILR